MLNRYSVTLFLLAVTFASCDPGIGVVISNKSRLEKNIRVIYPSNYRLPINTRERTNDSLQTYDHTQTNNTINARDYYRYPEKIPILLSDAINRSYSFNLKATHEVIIESRWPASLPTLEQILSLTI